MGLCFGTVSNLKTQTMDLNIGQIITGNEYCFQGRVEILEILEESNEVKVELTAPVEGTDRFMEWTEMWDLQVVKSGLKMGEYKTGRGVLALFMDYPQTRLHVHEAWDFVTKDDEGNLVMAQLGIPYTKAEMLADKADLITKFHAEIHDIEIKEVFTQLNRDEVIW